MTRGPFRRRPNEIQHRLFDDVEYMSNALRALLVPARAVTAKRLALRYAPPVPKEIIDLIRKMSAANICWGSPRIVGELRKLGIDVAKSTVEKYRMRPRKPPSTTWKSFLNNHAKDMVSIDFLVVPTVGFRMLYVLVVLSHHRRQVVYFNVTAHPTAQWTGQQIIEAFPFDPAPKYLIRDRDGIYGSRFRKRVKSMSIEEILTAPRSCGSR